ncbi:hypothetical protein [Microbacterium sp. SGAir0570]|uniref:hypothetical protein n=1 Tax=Microbacterium sp. SGAir0570 TaxID=2070348 RepID=UPI0015E85ED5|nr:hypothetical protein [Microbacterium sp. SGAir0570]
MTTSTRARRGHDGHTSWWRREYGGLPGWGLAVMLTAIASTLLFSFAIILDL